MEAIIDRTVRPINEGLQSLVPLLIVEVGSSHVERPLTDVPTAPDHSALGKGLVDLMESVLQSRLCTLSASEATLGNPRGRLENQHTQVLPAGFKTTLKCQVVEASSKESTSLSLPPTLYDAKSLRGRANVEHHHGK